MTGPTESKDDALTLAGLGVLGFTLAVVTHEGLGHGLATLAVGAKPVILTSCYFGSSGSLSRWIPAAGGIANTIAGLLLLVILRSLHRAGPRVRLFLVLAAAFNLFFAAAYPAYSGVAGFGDWAAVIAGLSPAWLYRSVLVAASVLLYYLWLRLVGVEFRPFAGSSAPQASARLQRITLIPFLAAVVAAALAGAFNPSGWTILLKAGIPSAACAFGLTQMDHFAKVRPGSEFAPLGAVTRSTGWIVAAAIALALFAGLLGPGIKFSPHQ